MKKKEKTNKNRSFGKTFVKTLSIINLLCGMFLIFNIWKMAGIESGLRYFGMCILALIDIFLLIISLAMKKKSISKMVFLIVIQVVLIGAQAYGGYFIFKTLDSLGSMSKDKITYTSVAVTLKDSKIKSLDGKNDLKIGIIKDETSIDNYVLGTQIIKNKGLEKRNDILYYEDCYSLIEDLYSKKLDVIIISDNYPSMVRSLEKYENIEQETRSIDKLSKTYKKTEISSITKEKVEFETSSIDKPFSLLVMGIDSTATNLSKNAVGNGDTLIVITYNPKTLNVTILSIPRDSYVPISCLGNNERKINSAALYGESCMINTIENFLDIDINYYVKINFKGVVNLVNALGGVDVVVPKDICEQNSNRARGKNLVCIKKGAQTLNGEQALALARHRKTLATGDLERGQNQQLVIQGIMNKVKDINSPAQLLSILDTVSKSMDTNLSTKHMLSFYNIAKDIIKTTNKDANNFIKMQRLYISGSGQMIYDTYGKLTLWDYVVNKSSVSAVTNAIKTNLGLKKPTIIKKMAFSINDNYTETIIGKAVTTSTTLYQLVPDFKKYTQSSAISWGSSKGVKINFTTQESTSSAYYDGQIIAQSVPSTSRVDKIGSSGITLTIIKKGVIPTPEIDVGDENNETPGNEDNPSNDNENNSENNNE